MTQHAADRTSATPLSWETEVFVLTAADRGALRREARKLADFIGRSPRTDLKDLAYTLASDLTAASAASRLAVVAASAAELCGRLDRAAERLADATVCGINDSQGIYYTDEPLAPAGRLALLFPGEGGQYPNMLADLIDPFPEVREHFEQCDRLSLRAGRAEPISRALHLPPRATEDERARAARELWRLDVAIAGMLIADWSIFRVLTNLGLRPDTVAGHSSGEFSALTAAGCLEHGDFLIEQLFALGHELRRQEDKGRMAEAVLLAAATSCRQAEEVIARTGAAVQVAMDNCPHQVVLAGSSDAAAAVEADLRGRGVICERLAFGRPYHTPHFRAHLAAVERLFETLTVRPPQIPVSSCMTGRPFPHDPAAIRRLAVEHWAAPVEFVRMIETMYADGVRLFAEAGPRGHLSSFVADILRSRPHVAVAANIPHRPGVTQLNHLAAQLVAHHVPLDLRHFYSRRAPRRVVWKAVPNAAVAGAGVAGAASSKPRHTPRGIAALCLGHPGSVPASARAAVMTRYMQVMDRFLDLQRDTAAAFQGRHTVRPARSQAVRPMLGEILTHVAGARLVMRRRIDLSEDLYARDHTLGGRHASAIDASHHGLPVMPMAFSMEMMAEAAATLLPGRVVRLEGVRLHRWIALDVDPVTLEVEARVLAGSCRRVAASIRDLGNTSHLPAQETPSVEAVVELADSYPAAPAAGDFPLTNPGPCLYSPHQLYEGERRMFHGPLFQAVCATDRQGDEVIEGRLRALPHGGLFRSHPVPEVLTDPLLIDASTHLLGCWHLARPDPAGRVVFPYEIGALDLFAPPPPAGAEICCRVRVERRTARQVRHRIELIGCDGRLLYRLAPAEYWRFYWPQEYVDFFRFKEHYLLAHPWPRPPAGSDELPPHHVARAAQAAGGVLRLDIPDDLRQGVLRASVARVALSRTEWRQFTALRAADDEITAWLYGRLAAKDYARARWWRPGKPVFPADLDVDVDGGHAVVRRRCGEPVRVTLAHQGGSIIVTAPDGHDLAGNHAPSDCFQRALS
jgi:malonyl CoA-acyl carrier protein transacylase